MAAPVLQFKRGLLANLPGLRAGEPGFTTDSYDLYVGLTSETSTNQFVGSGRYWTINTATTGSGVNLVEGTDNGTNRVTLKAPDSVGTSVTFTMPSSDGSSGDILTTDGSGTLSFSAPASSVLDIAGDSGSDGDGITIGTDTLTFTGGEGIDTTISDNTVTIDAEIASSSNAGVSSFSASYFSVTAGGDVSIQDAAADGSTKGVATFDADDFDASSGVISLGDSANGAVLAISATSNETTVSRTNGTVTIGIADDLTIPDSLTVTNDASVGGALTVTGALDVNTGADISGGETTLSSATVSDLTSGRVVLAGTSGALEDSGNLTFNGSLLTVTGDVSVTDSISVTNDVNVGGALTATTLTLSNAGIAVTAILDEDGMTSDRADALATQQSIKAYVDTAVGNVDVETDLSDGTNGSTINTSQTLTIQGTAAEVEVGLSGQTFTIGLPNDVTVGAALTVTTALDVNGGADISGGETTLSSATVSDLTSGRVVLAGTSGALEDSGNLTFDGTTLTVTGAAAIDNISIDANTITTSSGGLTLDSTDGTVTVADNLSITGNLTVLGSQAIVNTETLKVEDSLVEVGLVNSGGSLVAPSSDANIDVGLVMHYYSGSAKTAALFWDDSAGRVVVASEVTESSSVMGSITYADFEIGGLYVNGCTGSASQVITCSDSTIILENITVDGGSF